MYSQVRQRLRGSVGAWHYALENRYGDPRVYAQQQRELQQRENDVAYDLSRRNSALLDDAYAKQTSRAKEAHTKRITKHRENLAKRPQPVGPPPRKTKPQPSSSQAAPLASASPPP